MKSNKNLLLLKYQIDTLKVVKEYKMEFGNLTPIEKRTDKLFLEYFDKIWNDIA